MDELSAGARPAPALRHCRASAGSLPPRLLFGQPVWAVPSLPKTTAAQPASRGSRSVLSTPTAAHLAFPPPSRPTPGRSRPIRQPRRSLPSPLSPDYARAHHTVHTGTLWQSTRRWPGLRDRLGHNPLAHCRRSSPARMLSRHALPAFTHHAPTQPRPFPCLPIPPPPPRREERPTFAPAGCCSACWSSRVARPHTCASEGRIWPVG